LKHIVLLILLFIVGASENCLVSLIINLIVWLQKYENLTVCLSVRPSVTLCVVAERYVLQQK